MKTICILATVFLLTVWNAVCHSGMDGSAKPIETQQATANPGPAPRYAHQMMTFDESRTQTLLFGGSGQNESYGDLWAWDGRDWHLLSETGPPPRNSGVLVYDSRRNRTVLFGGRGKDGELSDTWDPHAKGIAW